MMPGRTGQGEEAGVGARAIREAPEFVTNSEREVWELLVAQLRDEDVVLANVRLTDETKDHEADLVVLMPGAGIVVVEVKGGSVWVDRRTGAWHQRRSRTDIVIDPGGPGPHHEARPAQVRRTGPSLARLLPQEGAMGSLRRHPVCRVRPWFRDSRLPAVGGPRPERRR